MRVCDPKRAFTVARLVGSNADEAAVLKKVGKGLQHRLGSLQLREMADTAHRLKPILADKLMQGFATFNWNPRIVLTPNNLDRASDVTKQRFDFRRVLLICLGELPVETAGTFIRQPRCDKVCKVSFGDLAHKRALNIGFHNGLVDVAWKTLKRVNMLADMIKELRPPWTHCDHVHKDIALEVAPVKKVGPQRCRPSEVMGNNRWST